MKEEQTLSALAAKYEIQPNQLTRWKSEFLQNAGRAFSKETDEAAKLQKQYEQEVDELHRQIGQLIVEVNWAGRNKLLLAYAA